jgi:uncharacterized repeat protein (TIGR03803 family)
LTTLHSFDLTFGAAPYGGLVQAPEGSFYGTTEMGGANGGDGTVFRLTPEGGLTILDNFDIADGRNPVAGLILATGGKFYGTVYGGGAGYGTIFSVTLVGSLTTFSFGAGPMGGLVQGTDGNFYGATNRGGAGVVGTVFSLSVGLGPFVKTLPTSGAIGAAVIILGTDLTGATSVTFNGTVAAFTVVSATEITATVPTGATTGKLQVTTPGGTLSSNLPFRVTP